MDPRVKAIVEEVEIPPEERDEALTVYRDALRMLALSTSVIANITISICHVAFTKSKQFSTFAVTLAGDGMPILVINTDFIRQIGHKQAVFALTHEAYHLLWMHLHTDPAFAKNPNAILATEVVINQRVTDHLKQPLIMIDGKVVIVDPKQVYADYRDKMKDAGRTPISFEDFVRTDLGCFAALEDMPKPPKQPKGAQSCVHATNGGAGNNDDGSPAPLDQSEVDKFMDKVLTHAVAEAKNGRKDAREEILSWMDASPEASQRWGDLGANTLRGETTVVRKTDLWEMWTADIIGTRLEDGTRLRYNKKVPWNPRVSANGKQPHKYGAVFVDTSGSMDDNILRKVAAIIGECDGLTVEWHAFDARVIPFKLGESLTGGGGTSFQVIDDHVENASELGHDCCDVDLDFVLVITDGYAPEILPSDPEKWIWLITPGGTAWPELRGMSCRQIDLP